MARKPSTPFNGADPAAFDHDGDGAPGGSLPNPVRSAWIDLETGAVVVLSSEAAAWRGETVRAATDQDLEIAGRRDLIVGSGDIAPSTPSNG